MRILLITTNYLAEDATGNCLRSLVSHLMKRSDVEIANTGTPKSFPTDNGVKVYIVNSKIKLKHIKSDISLNKNQILCEIRAKGFAKGTLEVLGNLYHRLLNKLITLYNEKVSPKVSYFKLKKVFENGNYDCILSVCMPFSNHILACKLKKKFPYVYWIANYYDPHSLNVHFRDRFKKLCKQEDKVLEYADKIILTPILYEEFGSCRLKKHLERSVALEFPNLIYRDINKPNTTIEFDKNYINCVFTGYLYAKIRNPRYLFELLNKSDKNIRLYIVGGYGDSEELNIDYYSQLLGDRLVFVDFVPIEEAFRIMNDADVLVNISNAAPNQLPSKLFDYFSTGKPVINIHKLEKCLSLPYAQKYPLAVNIHEKDEVDASDVETFETFCKEARGKKLDFSVVEEIYKTSTPQYVAERIVGDFENKKIN